MTALKHVVPEHDIVAESVSPLNRGQSKLQFVPENQSRSFRAQNGDVLVNTSSQSAFHHNNVTRLCKCLRNISEENHSKIMWFL